MYTEKLLKNKNFKSNLKKFMLAVLLGKRLNQSNLQLAIVAVAGVAIL